MASTCVWYIFSPSPAAVIFFSVVEMQHVPMFLFIFFFPLWLLSALSGHLRVARRAAPPRSQLFKYQHKDARTRILTRVRSRAHVRGRARGVRTHCGMFGSLAVMRHSLPVSWPGGTLDSGPVLPRNFCCVRSAPPPPIHPPASTFSLRIACNTKPNLNSLLCSTSQNGVLCVF